MNYFIIIIMTLVLLEFIIIIMFMLKGYFYYSYSNLLDFHFQYPWFILPNSLLIGDTLCTNFSTHLGQRFAKNIYYFLKTTLPFFI